MFSLRQKLFLGFGGLLLIIALTGIQSISKVTELGDAIDVILEKLSKRARLSEYERIPGKNGQRGAFYPFRL